MKPTRRRGMRHAVMMAACVGFALTAVGEGSWTRFGGPNADFRAVDANVASTWPKDGPRELWRKPLGAGYASVAVDGDTLFTGYLDGDEDVVIALDAQTGDTRWTYRQANKPVEANVTHFGRGPNATPLVLADRVVTMSYTGILTALDRKDGSVLWSHDTIADLGAVPLQFGHSASPIAYGEHVIVLVGGDQHGAVAFDPKDGTVAWSSEASTVSYASPVVIDVAGQDQLLYFTEDDLRGIDPANGKVLWRQKVTNGYRNHASMPIWNAEENLLWVATQQEGAGRALRLTRDGDATTVEKVWANNKVKIHFWNAVWMGDTVYASLGDQVKLLSGVDAKTGKILWRERDYGLTNFVATGDGALLLNEEGLLANVELTPKGMTVRAKTTLDGDGDFWTAPTVIGDRLYLRDKSTIRALDIGTGSGE